MLPHLNELQYRVVAGATSELLGRGRKSAMVLAAGLSRSTVTHGESEVAAGRVTRPACATWVSVWATCSLRDRQVRVR